jgi:hypothetical protein
VQAYYGAVTRHGTFALYPGWDEGTRFEQVAHRLLSRDYSSGPTFSEFGKVRPIELIRGNSSSDIWFNRQLSNHYRPDYHRLDPAFRLEDHVAFIYRKNNVTEERLEPVSRREPHPDLVEEWLYIHFQEHKRKGESIWAIQDQW